MARTPESYDLTVADLKVLEASLSFPKTAESLVLRVRIVLLSSVAETIEAVSSSTGASTHMTGIDGVFITVNTILSLSKQSRETAPRNAIAYTSVLFSITGTPAFSASK
jgi:hypothetical protein